MAAATRRLPVRLFDGAQRLLERLGRSPRRFAESEEELLDAARRAEGCDDFGSDVFRPGLRVLLRAYDEEARLTPFGRMLVAQELHRILRNRLAVQRGWTGNPAALADPVRRPLFVLGLPRTGTTVLHHLLAQDPEHQVLEYWLAAAPGPRPPPDRVRGDPRYRQAVRDLRITYYLDPGLKAIHELSADGPEECRHLLAQCFTDDTFDSNATIPSYTRWYRAQDMRPVYAHHRDVLKLIQSTGPQRRWVLKYPAHMTHLHVLLETYPDACVIQTHRDPTEVLPSLCSLVTGWRGIYEQEVDVRQVARWQVEMWAGRLEHALDVRRTGDPARFCDLHFRELAEDPIAAVRRVYGHFGLELTEKAERSMRSWLAAHPQGRHGAHGYSAEQFGLVREELAERFAPYLERLG